MRIIVDEGADSRQCEALRKTILGGDMELKDRYGRFAELHLSDSGGVRQTSDRSLKPGVPATWWSLHGAPPAPLTFGDAKENPSAMSNAIAAPLQTQRRIILVLLLSVAAASWALLLWQAAALDMSGMGPTMGLAAPLFLTIWIVMMVAMMFPTAAPMVLIFHQVQAGKRQRGETFVATWVFVAAYLFVWTLAGVIAYGAAVLSEMLAQSAGLSAAAAARVGGALLIVAGLYQLTPLKSVCLSQCRTPIGFVMNSWRDGLGGALRMGVEHGLYCLGCCWLLFVILFPLGIMNVAAMAVITVLIFAEKAFPWGVRIAQLAAGALVLYGIVVLFVPSALPTFMAGQSAEMPGGQTNTPAPGNETPPKPAAPDAMPGMKM